MSVDFRANEPEVFEMEIESNRIPRQLSMAFGISLVLHVVLLGSLAMIKFADKMQAFTTITSGLEDEVDPDQYKFDSTITDQLGSDSDINSFAASQEAAVQLSKDPQKEVERTIAEDVDVPTPRT